MSKNINMDTPVLKHVKEGLTLTAGLMIHNATIAGAFAIATNSAPAYAVSGALFLAANSIIKNGKRRITACQRAEARKHHLESLGFTPK